MDLLQAAQATGGTAFNGNPEFGGVFSDSRRVTAGELFVALKGDRFDGHDFVRGAIEGGAAAAMVERAWAAASQMELPLLAVEDTRRALGQLAAAWRARFDIPLIGITGSNGKTTVKEMCAAILRAHAASGGFGAASAVLATEGNLNNDIGMPLTLLQLRAGHGAAVIEMGMNHPGEIGYLTVLAQPTVALVNNAQRAHLEGLGTVADVAREKGSIYGGLAAQGVAVINADDAFADYWRGLNQARRIVSFGVDRPADVSAEYVLRGLSSQVRLRTAAGGVDFELRVPGLHNVRNALAAAACAGAAGVPLECVGRGLGSYAGVKGRLQVRSAAGGATLIDDSYNANPDSVFAALDVLAATPGRQIFVFGDMGETGDQGGQFHADVGGYAKSQGVDLLFALGKQSELAARDFGPGGRHFARVEDLIAALRRELRDNTVVLVKGSRFMRMERVADAIAGDVKP